MHSPVRRTLLVLLATATLLGACARTGTDDAAGPGSLPAGSVPSGTVPTGTAPGGTSPGPDRAAPSATGTKPEADPTVAGLVPEPLTLADGTVIAPGGGGATPTPTTPGGVASSSTTSTVPGPTPSPKIQAIVDAYRTKHDIVGIAVAVVQPGADGAPAVVPYYSGTPSVGSATPVGAGTQFEMGSETKTFTAALLASLVAAGKVSLDDPLQKWVPAGVTVPRWSDGTQITLGHLATHQSGLADEPANLPPGSSGKHDYTLAMLWSGLPNAKLLWKPGTNWLYSNYGFGLLGSVLANIVQPNATESTFGPAVGQVLTSPLGMASTLLEDCDVTTCPQMPALATPYGAGRAPVPYWNNNNALAGGGGLVTRGADMGTWIAAALGYPSAISSFASSPLQPVSTISTVCKQPDSCAPATAGFRMGMAWQLYQGAAWFAEPYAFKNGGTNGMHSTTYLVPGRKLGVTALSDAPSMIDPLGQYIVHAIVTGQA